MSQLGKQLRRRFHMEPDFLTMFPGDLQPDIAAPGTPVPYMVVVQSENVVNYDLVGLESHIIETTTITAVCGTRAEAEACCSWVRDKLRPPSWSNVATDTGSSYLLMWWRLDTFTDTSDAAVDGDDSIVRIVSFTVTGNFRYVGVNSSQQPDTTTPTKAPTAGGDFDGDGLEH